MVPSPSEQPKFAKTFSHKFYSKILQGGRKYKENNTAPCVDNTS